MLRTPDIPQNLRGALFVYIDRKPDGEPFYVGIGDAARVGMRKRHTNDMLFEWFNMRKLP